MATRAAPAGAPGRRLARVLDRHASLVLLAPLMLVVAAVVAYPLGYSLWVSVVDYDVAPTHPWVGLRNYRAVLDFSTFPQALARTAALCAAAVAIEFVLGFLLALAVVTGAPWRRRLIPFLVLPVVAGAVAAGLFWRLLLDPEAGAVNFVLGELSGHPVTADWTSGGWRTFTAIVIADVWQWTPIVFLILYAGLRTIPDELYEAAGLDGASAVRTFWFVTVPLLMPFAALALLIRLVDGMRLFDVPSIVAGPNTDGETAARYLYDQGFTYFHLGFASAASWLFVLVIAAIACPLLVILLRSGGRSA